MIIRAVWGVLVSLVAIGACFFIAGNLDPFSWGGGSRAAMVFVVFFAFGMTVTCPFLKEL